MYTPTTWQDGDIITAAKLNKIEDGIEHCNAFFVHVTLDTTVDPSVYTTDMTLAEVMAKVNDGLIPIYILNTGSGMIQTMIASRAETDSTDLNYGVTIYYGETIYAHTPSGFIQLVQPET